MVRPAILIRAYFQYFLMFLNPITIICLNIVFVHSLRKHFSKVIMASFIRAIFAS